MAASTCLHIQERESGPIRVVALPWLWARVGRASYCEIRLNGEHLPDELCRLQRKGRTWYVMATSTEQQVLLGGRQVRGSSLLPFDVPIEAAGHRLTLRSDISCEPVWELGDDRSPLVVLASEPSIDAAANQIASPPPVASPAVSNSAGLAPSDSATKRSVQRASVSSTSEPRKGGLSEALRRAELAGLPTDRVSPGSKPVEARAPSAGLGHRAAGWEAKWRAASAEIRSRPRPEPMAPTVERKVPTAPVPPRPLVSNHLPHATEPRRPAESLASRPGLVSMTPPISRVAPASALRNVHKPGIPRNATPLAKNASQPRTPLRATSSLADASVGARERPLITSSFDSVNELIALQSGVAAAGLAAMAPGVRGAELRGRTGGLVEEQPRTEPVPEVAPTDLPRMDSGEDVALEPITAVAPHIFEQREISSSEQEGSNVASDSNNAVEVPVNEPGSIAASGIANSAKVAKEGPVDAPLLNEGSGPEPMVAEAASANIAASTNDTVEAAVGSPAIANDSSSAEHKPDAERQTPVVEQGATKPVVHERRPSAYRAVVTDRTQVLDRGEERRRGTSHRDAAAMARAASTKNSKGGRSSGRSGVDWPSAASVLALHRAMVQPSEAVSRNRQGRIQALPTKSREPDHWSVPAWLALPPVALIVLLVGAAGILLSSIWANDSYNASYVMHSLLYANPGPRRQTLPTTIAPPPASWARTTGQHLAYWGIYKKANAISGDASQSEAAALLAGALLVSPLDPLARLAVAQLESRGEHLQGSAHAVGLSRDSVSLGWSARSLAKAGKKTAALALYVRALEVASRDDLRAAGVPRFSEDPKVPRYLLPGEDRYREIIQSMMASDVWTIHEWTQALPALPVVRLAAGRILREQGRSEADGLIEGILAETKLVATDDSADPLVLAARAEALAIKGGFKESGREYRQAIEAMPNDWIRRSWWFNVADIAYRMEDETERQSALRYALAVATSDDITRRATDTQRAVGNRRALGSAVPRAN